MVDFGLRLKGAGRWDKSGDDRPCRVMACQLYFSVVAQVSRIEGQPEETLAEPHTGIIGVPLACVIVLKKSVKLL